MAKVRLTKIFTFEMAHTLLHHDGLCRNIHGHSYILHVTISGYPLEQKDHPKDGMVMDFKDLKKIVKSEVIDVYDHAFVLNERSPSDVISTLSKHYEKIVTTPFQPTCELLLEQFAGDIKNKLPEGVTLHSLKLYETASSYAEWYASDN